MRYLVLVVLSSLALSAQAQLSEENRARLCEAATKESAFGAVVDELVESGVVQITAGEQLLSASCQDGQSVLGRMVNSQQAENLEYAVIDLGLSLSESRVALQGQMLTLEQALNRLAEQGSSDTRRFVQEYLDNLSDAEFNPNLRLSLK